VKTCDHTDTIRDVVPSARGCEECLNVGSTWVHLRLCRSCGHVGCCDNSPLRHARAHYEKTGHPIIEVRISVKVISGFGERDQGRKVVLRGQEIVA